MRGEALDESGEAADLRRSARASRGEIRVKNRTRLGPHVTTGPPAILEGLPEPVLVARW